MLNLDDTKGFKCNSFKVSNKWSRKIKLLNNLLPTLDRLKERYPNIINHTVCLFCNKEQESLDHLTLCSSLDNT